MLRLLSWTGEVRVTSLAYIVSDMLDVTPNRVRRAITYLAEEGDLIHSYGLIKLSLQGYITAARSRS